MMAALIFILAGCYGGQTASDHETRGIAYAGSPPTIPHAVESLGRGDCLDCHQSGLQVTFEDMGTLRAPVTPHPYQEACRQCHVQRAGGWIAYGKNKFAGARYPSRGTRAHPGAPPTIPHRLQNRGNCLACHGKLGNMTAPESPHKQRSQCRQCHVPGISDFGFRIANSKISPLDSVFNPQSQ